MYKVQLHVRTFYNLWYTLRPFETLTLAVSNKVLLRFVVCFVDHRPVSDPQNISSLGRSQKR